SLHDALPILHLGEPARLAELDESSPELRAGFDLLRHLARKCRGGFRDRSLLCLLCIRKPYIPEDAIEGQVEAAFGLDRFRQEERMARIPGSEVERLKREVPLVRLVEARGIELKKHGADLMGRCPFHDDRTPSLVVSPKKNLWHCLGACQAGGSVIDWVMKTEGISFRHAVELLRADVPVASAAPSDSPPPARSTVARLPPPVDAEAGDRELLLQVVGYYHEALKASPEALAYLESRGLRSPEMVERFRLGFANRTLGYRLPAKNRKAGEAIRGRLTALGIFRETGHEHLNGCVVIPIFDETGAVVEMYGRKITPGLKKGIPLHLYL